MPAGPSYTRRDLRVVLTDADTVRPLRRAVLRPQLPEADSRYAADPVAAHFAAYLADVTDRAEPVGVATVFPQDHPETGEAAWRLRGMAVAAEARGTGCGGALLTAVLQHVAGAGGRLLWCNARLTALGFYARYGFTVDSDTFLVPGGGEHRRMRRAV